VKSFILKYKLIIGIFVLLIVLGFSWYSLAAVPARTTVGDNIIVRGSIGIGTAAPGARLHVVGTSTFTEAINVAGVSNPTTPRGGIIMYSGTWNFDATGLGTGPLVGWALCNGNNGTPNLSNRFVRSTVTSGGLGVTGGTTTHTHIVDSHSHSVDPPPTTTSFESNFDGAESTGIDMADAHHTHTLDIAPFSSGAASPGTSFSEHLPPFFQLAFIMKL